MSETKNSNGARKLGEWVLDKMIIFVLGLVAMLLIWLVTQVFAINGSMETIKLENAQKVHDLEMKNADRIAALESDIKLIKQITERTEDRLNDVCKELKVR